MLAFVIHTFVIPQIGGARAALSTVSSASPWLIGLAAALEVGAIVAYGVLTRLLLPPEPQLGIGFCSSVALASMGVNHVVPGGAATTAAVNYRLFGRAGVPGPQLAFALGTQALGSAVVLNLLLWLALVASIPATGFDPLYATAAGVGAVLMAVFASALVALRMGRDGLAHHGARILGRLPRLEPAAVEVAIRDVAARLDILVANPRVIVQGVTVAAANWLLDAAALATMLAAFGHRPSIVGLLVAYGLANVMAAIPITPGGLGVVEAILIPTLVGFGTPTSVAAVGVVAYRLVSFWLPIPAGLTTYAVLQRRSAKETSPVGVGTLLGTLLEHRVDEVNGSVAAQAPERG